LPSDKHTADLQQLERPAWLAALATFVLGDVSTTAVGLNIGAVETNPLPIVLFDLLGVWPAMLLLKAVVLGLLGLLSVCSPPRLRPIVPATLAAWGAAVVTVNTYMVGVVLA